MIRRDDFVALHFTAGFLFKLISFHLASDVLDLLAIQGFFANAEFEAVVFRWIVARRHFYPAVHVGMKHSKIAQRRRRRAYVDTMQPDRCDPSYNIYSLS